MHCLAAGHADVGQHPIVQFSQVATGVCSFHLVMQAGEPSREAQQDAAELRYRALMDSVIYVFHGNR